MSAITGSGSVGADYQAAMLRKLKDNQELQGQAAMKLIEDSSNAGKPQQAISSGRPHVGSLLNVYA